MLLSLLWAVASPRSCWLVICLLLSCSKRLSFWALAGGGGDCLIFPLEFLSKPATLHCNWFISIFGQIAYSLFQTFRSGPSKLELRSNTMLWSNQLCPRRRRFPSATSSSMTWTSCWQRWTSTRPDLPRQSMRRHSRILGQLWAQAAHVHKSRETSSIASLSSLPTSQTIVTAVLRVLKSSAASKCLVKLSSALIHLLTRSSGFRWSPRKSTWTQNSRRENSSTWSHSQETPTNCSHSSTYSKSSSSLPRLAWPSRPNRTWLESRKHSRKNWMMQTLR